MRSRLINRETVNRQIGPCYSDGGSGRKAMTVASRDVLPAIPLNMSIVAPGIEHHIAIDIVGHRFTDTWDEIPEPDRMPLEICQHATQCQVSETNLYPQGRAIQVDSVRDGCRQVRERAGDSDSNVALRFAGF